MTNTASTAVELGAVTTREGARLHIASGCGWSHLLTTTGLVELTEANADRTCRNCRKAIRAALEAARTANGKRTEFSHAVKVDKIEVDGRLTALVNLFLTAAEMTREAELKSRMARPVYASSGFSGAVFHPVAAAAPVKDDLLALIESAPKTAFVEAVERMGVRADRVPVRPTVKSKRARLAALNLFATPKPKAA